MTLPLFLLRLGWIGAHLVALFAFATWCDTPTQSSDRFRLLPLRFYPAYLMTSALAAAVYWPEAFPDWDWYDAFWPLLLTVLLLRTAAVLESLHHQTARFEYWSRLTAGAFVFALVPVLAVWVVKDGGGPGSLLTQYRRYLQLWTAMVVLTVEMMWWAAGRMRRGRLSVRDYHALLLSVIALNHCSVSVVMLGLGDSSRLPKYDGLWKGLNLASTGIDSACYLGFGIGLCVVLSRGGLRSLSTRGEVRPAVRAASASAP